MIMKKVKSVRHKVRGIRIPPSFRTHRLRVEESQHTSTKKNFIY